MERRLETSASASTPANRDNTSAPHLQRSKSSSNCFPGRTSCGVGLDSERRPFLPSIERTGTAPGHVTSLRHRRSPRPATSTVDTRHPPLNDRPPTHTDDVGGGCDVPARPHRASAVTVWNSLERSPASNNNDPARASFVPTPPPRRNSAGNN